MSERMKSKLPHTVKTQLDRNLAAQPTRISSTKIFPSVNNSTPPINPTLYPSNHLVAPRITEPIQTSGDISVIGSHIETHQKTNISKPKPRI